MADDTPGTVGALPVPSERAADAVRAWLQERYQMKRPPYAGSAIICFCAALQRARRPYPGRMVVAAHLGLPLPTYDSARLQAERRGLIRRRNPSYVVLPELMRLIEASGGG